jgi:hypothetical protein
VDYLNLFAKQFQAPSSINGHAKPQRNVSPYLCQMQVAIGPLCHQWFGKEVIKLVICHRNHLNLTSIDPLYLQPRTNPFQYLVHRVLLRLTGTIVGPPEVAYAPAQPTRTWCGFAHSQVSFGSQAHKADEGNQED